MLTNLLIYAYLNMINEWIFIYLFQFLNVYSYWNELNIKIVLSGSPYQSLYAALSKMHSNFLSFELKEFF